ncbi:MAG: HlyD family efflux transporter periplasmic adaptor subunit [Acetatifactor sp.]
MELTKGKLTKKRKKLILMLGALLLLILAACYTVFIAPLLEKEEWIYKESVVERGTLTVGVTESGTLEYGITSVMYDLDLDVSDDDEEDEDEEEETVQKYLKIEEVYAASGQRISAGDALIRFTEDSVSDVRQLLQNALVDAKSEYNEAEAEYNLSLLEAQTDYDTKMTSENYAQSIYNNAKTSVANYIDAIRTEIEQRTANIASLEEKLADAQESYNDILEEYTQAKESYETYKDTDNVNNFMVFQNDYLTAQTQYQNAKTALEQAQQNLKDNEDKIASLQLELQTESGKKTIDTLEVEETYKEAVINGENAEITYNAKVESLKEELAEAEEEKKELEEKLAAFEAFVGEDGVLYAEGEGIVTQSAYEAGDTLKQSGVLVAYAEPENMTISVDMAQEDVVGVAVGDQVEIVFTAYEEQVYGGSILSIDTTATSANSNTVSYTVVIGVEGDTSQLYGGMVADITFVTEQKEDVLYVSRKAIVTENGKSYVYKKTALGGKELTEVETGISNGSSIEILSGLEEGDTIYIASRVSSESEVKSTSEGTTDSQNGSTDADKSGNFKLPDGMELPEGMDFNGGNEAGGMQMPDGNGFGDKGGSGRGANQEGRP